VSAPADAEVNSVTERTDNHKCPRRAWVGLALILLLYGGLAVAQSFATRLQWGPDEPGHIIYVQSLALDARLPDLTHSEADNAYLRGAARTHEAHQPPLYYALAALAWRAFADLPAQRFTYVDPGRGATHTFQVPGPVRPVRFLSVLLGALTLLFVWAAARTLFPERPSVWLGAVALTAFTPMFTYVNGVINNDPLIILFFAATAWQWARILRFGAARRDLLLLGLILGGAINAKETALGLVALSVVVMMIEPGAKSWPQRLARVATVLAIAAALGGWWYARKWAVYGTPLVYPYHQPLLELPLPERAARLAALPGFIFLCTFVPADVVSPHLNLALVAGFFGLVVVLSMIAVTRFLLRRRRDSTPAYQTQLLALCAAAALLVLVGWLRLVLTVDWRMGPIGGRFLLAVLPLMALAAARALHRLFGDGKLAAPLLALTSLLLLAMNLYAIFATAAEYGTLGL